MKNARLVLFALLCCPAIAAAAGAQSDRAAFADICTQAFEKAIDDTQMGSRRKVLNTYYQDYLTETNVPKSQLSYDTWQKNLLLAYRTSVQAISIPCCPVPRRPQCDCNLVGPASARAFENALAQLEPSVRSCPIPGSDPPEEPTPALRAALKQVEHCRSGNALDTSWQGLFEARGLGWCESFAEKGQCLPPEARPPGTPACDKAVAAIEALNELEATEEQAPSLTAADEATSPQPDAEAPPPPPVSGDDSGSGSETKGSASEVHEKAETVSPSKPEGKARAEDRDGKPANVAPVLCGESANVWADKTIVPNRAYEVFVVEENGEWKYSTKGNPDAKCLTVLLTGDKDNLTIRGALLGQAETKSGERVTSEVMGALFLPHGTEGASQPPNLHRALVYNLLNYKDGSVSAVQRPCKAQERLTAAIRAKAATFPTTFYLQPGPGSQEVEMVTLNYHLTGAKRGEFTLGHPANAMDESPVFSVAGGMEPPPSPSEGKP